MTEMIRNAKGRTLNTATGGGVAGGAAFLTPLIKDALIVTGKLVA